MIREKKTILSRLNLGSKVNEICVRERSPVRSIGTRATEKERKKRWKEKISLSVESLKIEKPRSRCEETARAMKHRRCGTLSVTYLAIGFSEYGKRRMVRQRPRTRKEKSEMEISASILEVLYSLMDTIITFYV